jgi:hypothetical protein
MAQHYSRPAGFVNANWGQIADADLIPAAARLARAAHLPILLASALATEAAILSNFVLNSRWTWRGAEGYS